VLEVWLHRIRTTRLKKNVENFKKPLNFAHLFFFKLLENRELSIEVVRALLSFPNQLVL
jgi:hypothetical protein